VERLGNVQEAADSLGVCFSTVYRALRPSKKTAKIEAVEPREKPMVSLSLSLPSLPGSSAEVQVRNGGGELLGTLRIESDGIRYRRPNQKSPADRRISWDALDKIMQLGLF
jgi:hypothetical protein